MAGDLYAADGLARPAARAAAGARACASTAAVRPTARSSCIAERVSAEVEDYLDGKASRPARATSRSTATGRAKLAQWRAGGRRRDQGVAANAADGSEQVTDAALQQAQVATLLLTDELDHRRSRPTSDPTRRTSRSILSSSARPRA